ncbi:DUF6174 domain-containing protein [Actinomycetes bacterium KLBMP 9797]
MRILAGLLMTMMAAAAGACGDEPPPASGWQEPENYTYVLQSSCGERPLLGRFRITVDGGEVTAAEGLSEADRRSLASTELRPPTLAQLLDELAEARRTGADVAELTTDPADGHPAKIMIDPVERALDDEACYTISEYTS